MKLGIIDVHTELCAIRGMELDVDWRRASCAWRYIRDWERPSAGVGFVRGLGRPCVMVRRGSRGSRVVYAICPFCVEAKGFPSRYFLDQESLIPVFCCLYFVVARFKRLD